MTALITFQSPLRIKVPAGSNRFWRHFTTTQCISILKFGTSYQKIQDPSDEQIEAADVTYLGGHIYEITEAEAAALTAAGYGAGLGGAVDGYGSGSYGGGNYGVGEIDEAFGEGPFGDGPFGG